MLFSRQSYLYHSLLPKTLSFLPSFKYYRFIATSFVIHAYCINRANPMKSLWTLALLNREQPSGFWFPNSSLLCRNWSIYICKIAVVQLFCFPFRMWEGFFDIRYPWACMWTPSVCAFPRSPCLPGAPRLTSHLLCQVPWASFPDTNTPLR